MVWIPSIIDGTLQQLPDPQDGPGLQLKVPLGVAYLELGILEDDPEIVHQLRQLDEMFAVSKQDSSNFTGGRHGEKNISEIK